MAMSDELGVAKPDAAFFARVLQLTGGAEPGHVAYAGDRIDNDVVPAAAAGMRAIWVRRGPWGLIQQLDGTTTPALVVDSLDELVERIGEAWPAGEG
jgi:FMN phosphatase YigB (HAD superfamily)